MRDANRNYNAVLFIDASVADAAALTAGVADNVLVVKLVSWRDGVEQIATVLRQFAGQDLDSVQIVSHGAEGEIRLGNTVLDADHLAAYQAALQEWGAALSADGDLLLYGCDVAAGDHGQAFIAALALATSADVAASTDTTGSTLLGANWTLESSTGAIEAASALTAQAQDDYAHTLALANNGVNGTITFTTNANVTLLNLTGLAAGAVVHADNILGLGLDLYTQSTNGGGVTVTNVNGTNLIGIPLSDDRLTVSGSLLSPVSYVDLRANSGVFDAVSLNIGSGGLLGNLVGTVVYTVYALDANYQPTGVGVSLLGLVINEYGLLNFASMANFKGIYGIRIVNPLGINVDIDDFQIANARAANTITSAGYNANTGVLTLNATGINSGDAIDPSKLTITGANGATYTLTSPTVSASSGTAAAITLNAADKLAINGLLNNNGSSSVDGTSFNLAAAANWDSNLSNGADLTGNPITVSNVQLPTITSASYNAATHVLTVSGSNLVGIAGANNDITVAKLGLKGEGGVTRLLTTSGNVEVSSANGFSVTLSGADIAAVDALFNKNGSTSAGGSAYALSALDDWNSTIGNANIAVSAALVVVNNTSNSAPTITGTATAGVNDNATISPFSGVTVADVNGDTVSLTISFNGANGSLSGSGLSGSNGSYTLSSATPAALTAQLKALVFTPTANQAAVGVGVNTTFTLVATDSNGAAGITNTATVVTATSVNDAPVLAGTAAAQNVTAGGTVRPFSAVTLSDPDVGATVIVKVTPDSAAKGAFTAASLSASGFVTNDGGVSYTLAAAAPAAAQAALHALVFQSTAGLNATTTFTVSMNDGSVIVTNNATSVVAAAPSSTTALSVVFSADSGISNSDLITNVAAQNLSGTLSGALASGETVQVSFDNGASWTNASASVGATSWSLANQTLGGGAGTLQVRVTNAGGSSTPLSASYTLDTTAPTTTSAGVTFSNDTGASATDLITKTAAQTISGTLSAALAADEHVEVSLNNGATWVTASSSAGAAGWTLAGQTLSASNTLQVRVVDAAGNAGPGTGTPYVLDTSAPTAALSSNVSVLKSGESATITLTFSEAVDGLALSDLSAVGGTLANLVATANPRVYTVDFTPNGGLSGLLGSVTLAANSYTDLAGNNGGGASSGAISITTLGPSVLITSNAAALKSGDTATITFTFSSAPSGFTASDIVATGGAVSNLASQGNGVYTALFTPAANYSAAASVTVTGGSYTDALGNQGGAGASPVLQVDTVAPTLAISSSLAAVKLGDSATITFTFSEAPLGFTAGDVTVSNGSLSGFAATANPLVYTALLTPDSGVASGAVAIAVAAGSYTDLAGNSGTAGTPPSISIDTLAPATTGASVSFSADTGVSSTDLITRTAAQTLSGTLSAPLAGGETVQVSLDNGASWVNASASFGNSGWSLAGQTLGAGAGTVQVRVSDAAGNHGTPFSAGYVLDTTAPTVQLGSDAGALKAGETATLTFTFSEAPANFSAASLTVTGGSVAAVSATADPLVYTAVFTPAASQSGVTATVQVKAGGYTDAAGNNGQASAATPIALNTTPPTLLITSNDVALQSGESATLTFTFSTPPTGFTASDINYSNGSLSGFAATANPLVYTALFTPSANLGAGTAGISVAAGAYTDAFGNSGGGASGPTINIDTLAPTVAITSNVAALKAGETATVTFTFSELPLGFSAGDVLTTGGTLSGLVVTANPLVYTALFTPTAGIQNVNAGITIAAGAFTDAAGNANSSAPAPTVSIDTLAPTAVANTVLFSADNGSSATDLVTNTAAQTISGTLASALGSGEYVEVSLDNGLSWTSATGAGTAWSLPGQTLAGSDVLKVRVSDAAGNHGAAYAVSYVLDTSAPTATLSSNVAALKAGDTATITITFSEAVSGFDLGDLSAGSGTLSNLVQTANPLVYTVLYTPNSGVNGVSDSIVLAAGAYTDQAGNAGAGASSAGISVDTQAPSSSNVAVSFSSDTGVSATDLVTSSAAQTISGTLGANLLGGEVVEVSLDNGNTWTAASGSAGAPGWSLAGQTLLGGAGHTVQVRVSDAAGNHGSVVSTAYTLDQSAPSLVISTSKLALNSADTPLITFTFSEAPSGFGAGSISVTGGSLSGFSATANPLVYTAVFTPVAGTAAGVATLSVAAGSYTDSAGNSGLGAAMPTITYATVAPGVAILSDVGALKAGDTANISFKFSTAPLGFGLEDIVVSGGTLSGLAATTDPLVYKAVFTPNSGVASGNAAISIANGLFTDGLGNPGVGGSLTALAIDTLAPTLSISSDATALNAAGTALISFTFSEAPALFTLGDISASNGTLSHLVQTANPLVYTAVFTPAANVASASAVISVATGAYADLAGNSGVAGSSPGISIDTLAPALAGATLLFSADTGSSATDLITNSAAQTIGGTLGGGTLALGDVVEVSLNNGASWQTASSALGGTSWSLAGQTLSSGVGAVQVRVSDSNGNHGAVVSYNYVLDTTAPTVSVSSDTSTLRAGQSATLSFTFSEAPAGFTLGDLIATGGTLSGFTATSNPLVYTVLLTPTVGFNGVASVTLGNGQYTDTAGNNGGGGSSPQISVDTLAPTLAITSSASALKVGETATITFTFSDAPAGFALGDISASNGSLSALNATANPLVYTATFTPTAGTASGSAVVSVAGGLYADAAGNPGAATASAPISIDTLAPTSSGASVTFSADNGASSTDLLTNAVTQVISGTLDAPVGAGEHVEVSLDNGATWLSALTTGAGQWALTPQLLSGSNTLQVRVSDSAGNHGQVFSAAYVLDLVAPTVTVTSSATALKAGDAATLTFTFSEAPTGFTVNDLVPLNGTLSGFTATANPLVYTVQLTPAAGLAGAAAAVTLAPGLYTDAAGNAGGGASSPLISVDTTAPALTISSSAASLKIGESATITFTFSEAPVGFTAGDVTVNGGVLSGFGLTANPLVYTAQFTPTAGVASGTATLAVAGGSYLDAAGNLGLAAALPSISYHTLAPTTGGATVTFSADTGVSSTDLVTNIALQTISGTLNAGLAAGETVEVSLDNGASWIAALGAVGAPGWSLAPRLLGGSGTLQVRVSDAAGNHGVAASSAYVLDTLAPGVTLGASASSLKAGDTATLTFTFSEVPQGFDASDLSAVGGTIGNLAAGANPLVYTATFTPQAGYSGAASVALAAGGYTDAAGNLGLGGTLAIGQVDTQPPSLTITSNTGALLAGTTALLTFSFSEVPVGFAVGDINASGGTLSGFTVTANPLVYTAVFTPTPGVANGSASISVAANTYSDAAGNGGLGGTAAAISINTVVPVAAAVGTPHFSADTGISSTDLITAVALQDVSGSLSAPLAAGEVVQVSFDNGASWIAATVDSGATTWTVAGHTLSGSGVLRVRVADPAGNHSAETATPYTISSTPVTVTVGSDVAIANGETPAVITFTFSAPPLGFDASGISVTGGTLGPLTVTSDPKVYTATFTPDAGVASGSASVTVSASYQDAAGNSGTSGAIAALPVDTVAPTAGIGSVAFSADSGTPGDLLTNVALQTISGTLDAALGLDERVEVSLDNGVTWLSAVTVGQQWTLAPQTLSGSGTLQVRVADLANNHGPGFSAGYVLDQVAPSMSVTSNATALKAGETAVLTLSFSKAPLGFGVEDLVAVNGTLSEFTATADPLVYTVRLTPSAGLNGATAAVTVAAGLYGDAAGNLGAAVSSPAITVDNVAPSLAITSNAAALKIGETALITFTFSEAPVGFVAGDISASGGTLSGFTASANPLVYTAVFTPTPGLASGSGGISVASNQYGDAAGNGGAGASLATPISIDTLAPTAAAVGTPHFSADTGISNTDLITAVAQQDVSGSLSAPLAAGEVVQVSFDNGASWIAAAVNSGATTWTVAGHTLSGSGVLRVRVEDPAGNHSAETVTPYTLSTTPVTVAVSSDVAIANGVAPAVITFTFSAPPLGFDASGITVSGGTLGQLTATSDPKVYTATFTPTAGVSSGTASVTVQGSYQDAAGNSGTPGAIAALPVDTVAPSATAGGLQFSNDSGAGGDRITNQPLQTLSGTLSAPLVTGDLVQISLDNGVTWQTVATAVGDSSWSVTRTLSGSGVLKVRVSDAAGNFSTAYSAPYIIDTTPPTISLASSGGTVLQGGHATISLTLSDPAVLTQGNLIVTGGAITGFSGSGTHYTVLVTPPVGSTTPITISVGGNLFSDAAGNPNTAATPLTVAVDTVTVVTPGTPSLVDGVEINTMGWIDARTGLPSRTVTVPNISSGRAEDTSTEHAALADIPLGIAASGAAPGTSLVVSLPLGVGFAAEGPDTLLSGALALTDLIGRIDDQTVAGQATRAAMEAQAQAFLNSMGNVQLQHATLTMSADADAANSVVIIDGSALVGSGGTAGSGDVQHDTAADGTAIALVIDARALPQGIGLQLDDVEFAAIIGAANVQGGAGQNFIIGDGEAQHIVLSTGSDNDTVYGNGGNDVLVTAGGNDYLNGGDGDDILAGGVGNDQLLGGAGNDVLQGGRSDTGQWQFYLKNGVVVGVHQTALAGATGTETVAGTELNSGAATLGFVEAKAGWLENLSLLYHAAFERAPDLPGLNFYALNETSLQQQAQSMLQSAEAAGGLMKLSNHDYVAQLLENTLGTAPSEAALAGYVAQLDAAASGDLAARAGVFVDIAMSAAHRALWITDAGAPLGGELVAQEQGWILNSGNDRLEGGAGNDLLVGGDGTDTVVYGGAAAGYSLALSTAGDVLINEPDGAQDTIRQIELGEFNGQTVDLNFTQSSAASLQELGMLYHLTLGRAGDLAGFTWWLGTGLSGDALAQGFAASSELLTRFGSLDDAAFVNLLYQNATQKDADSATLGKWDAYLESHSRAELVATLAADVTLVGSQYGTSGLSLIGAL